MLFDTLRTFYAEVATLCLATVDDAGLPHAANVNFVADDRLDLLFISHADSAHARHIASRPVVAAAAYAPFEHPGRIRGVQIHGLCKPIGLSEFNDVFDLFCRRMPYARAFEQRARSEQFYRLTPTWVRWIDNRVSFGHKVESSWPAD